MPYIDFSVFYLKVIRFLFKKRSFKSLQLISLLQTALLVPRIANLLQPYHHDAEGTFVMWAPGSVV